MEKLKLIGKLIGLARAAEGNEDKVNTGTAAVFAEALTEPGAGTAGRIEAEKRRLIPQCYECPNPCGRNDAYDMQRLQDEPAEVQSAKKRLIDRAREYCLPGAPTDEALRWICNALQLVGVEGLDAEYLQEMLN